MPAAPGFGGGKHATSTTHLESSQGGLTSLSVGPEISCTCSDTVARQSYVPVYWQQATVTGHRVRRKLHHQCKAWLHWPDLHSYKRLNSKPWSGLKGYISKSTLARAMSATTSNTRDTSNSSSCTPRLCTGLVTWNKYTSASNWEPFWGKKKKNHEPLQVLQIKMSYLDGLTCQFTDCIRLAVVLAHVGVNKIHNIRANWGLEHSRHDNVFACRFSFLGVNRD